MARKKIENMPAVENKDNTFGGAVPTSAENEIYSQKTYTQNEVDALIAQAAQNAVKEALADMGLSRLNAQEEKVTLLYMAEVSPENMLILPNYGSLRPGTTLEVPKKEFGGQFMGTLARKLIEKRHLIVTDGLTPDERERWGVDYNDGEILDIRAFDKMLDFDDQSLGNVFSRLCPEHQRFVARRILTAYERGDNRISAEKVKAINELTKGGENEGILRPVLEAMGRSFAE